MSGPGESRRTARGRQRRRGIGRRPARTTAGAALLGVLALGAAAVTPVVAPPAVATEQVTTVLFAVGAAGVVGAGLDYLLAPGRSPSPAVARDVYEAHAANGARVVADRGLSDRRVYHPVDEGDGGSLTVPVDDASGRTTGEAGATFVATGERLFGSFAAMQDASPPADPGNATAQLCDALVGGFELARSATPLAAGDGRVRVGVDAVTVADPGGFDHPVPSFLGVGLAMAAGVPVSVETGAGDEADLVVLCQWEADADRWHDGGTDADRADVWTDLGGETDADRSLVVSD